MSSASIVAPKLGSGTRSQNERSRASRDSVAEIASDPQLHPSGDRTASGAADRIRRAADIVLSSSALLILTPVFLGIALAVKATSPGPVLYRQTRVGWNRRERSRRSDSTTSGTSDRRRSDRRQEANHGRLFEIVKFRTMVVNAEEYGPQWSSENDPRITPIGRFLRLTRLDEIPQFWNVLRGDMAVIGPRPERPYFVEQFVEDVPQYTERLRARPGITGQAQVTLDYDASVDDVKLKVKADIDYLRSRSLRKDVGILMQTVRVVVTGKGAR
ncbi:MAG: capsular polysaccharide biosynthesis protein [Gemmatimonadota bacterium]|nr:MAG: capsular polysaccharide biosynthesis protein [Gemmatimonadota bacterium]